MRGRYQSTFCGKLIGEQRRQAQALARLVREQHKQRGGVSGVFEYPAALQELSWTVSDLLLAVRATSPGGVREPNNRKNEVDRSDAVSALGEYIRWSTLDNDDRLLGARNWAIYRMRLNGVPYAAIFEALAKMPNPPSEPVLKLRSAAFETSSKSLESAPQVRCSIVLGAL